MTEKEYGQDLYRPPAGATQVVLVRHGASAAFVPGTDFELTADGQGDPPLSEVGHEQAELTAKRLMSEPIDAIYVTTLQRTRQTAAPLAAATGITPLVEHDLREVYLGDWEGGLFRQKMAEFDDPIAHKVAATGRWDAVPGAESNEEFTARCLAGLGRVVAAHPQGRIVAVVHGGVIGMILGHAAGRDLRQFSGAANCSLHHLVVLNDTIAIRTFNDTAHLGPVFA